MKIAVILKLRFIINFDTTMYRKILLLTLFFLISNPWLAAQQKLAEKLGFARDAKLLIVHADDLGVSHSENMASLKGMEDGAISSASVMMPCPWAAEVAEYAREHEGEHDLGLHLTVTCEWKNYKWGPVASRDKVPSLLDEHGYLHADCAPYADKVDIKEIELELRAQIDLAYSLGLRPTHFDSHMGCLFFVNPDIFEIYVNLGREYNVPVLIGKEFESFYPDRYKEIVSEKDIVVDATYSPGPADYARGMAQYYENVLRNLKPGLSEIIIHTAYDDSEMRAITVDHPDWGAAWRQADFDFFISGKCQKIINEEDIEVVTWRQVKEAWEGPW